MNQLIKTTLLEKASGLSRGTLTRKSIEGLKTSQQQSLLKIISELKHDVETLEKELFYLVFKQ